VNPRIAAEAVLAVLGTPPTGQPQLDKLEDLERAAEALRGDGRFFSAGYGTAQGVHLAWGDGAAVERCVRQALSDYERAVVEPSTSDPEAVAALVGWSSLLGLNYVDDDRTAVRQAYQALEQVLAQRLIDMASRENYAAERCSILIRGFRLTTDLKHEWRLDFPDVDVDRGMTTFDRSSITLRTPSAFRVLVGVGDYVAAHELAEACPEGFTTHGLRGWRAATAGFTTPDQAVERFGEAADQFAKDVSPETPGPEGWSSINVDLWAKYFRARADVAEIIRSPARALELVTRAHSRLAGTDSGWTNPQVTCFRIVLEVLRRLFEEPSDDVSVGPREELLRTARISGLDESSTQALLFLDAIADAYEELRANPSSALVSGRLPTALRILGRVPLVGEAVAGALTPAIGERAHESLLGQQLTWIHRTLESIRDESVLRRVLLRLLQASPPLYAQLRHGPIEYGKDIAVLTEAEGAVLLTMYQVKAGDITKQNWPATRQELEEIFQVPLPEVQLPVAPDRIEAVLAFNGHLNTYVEPVVEGWVEEQLRDHGRSVRIEHLDRLVRWVLDERLINELRAALEEFGVTIVR
jgi:hypothetical protein